METPGQVRLCLSMSDYHPESWNPSWSIETLLVGLQSFMYHLHHITILIGTLDCLRFT
jgi:ubiquitin-protein ligase